jgi:hypothetical protein
MKGVADDKSRRPAAAAVAAQEGIDPALSSGSFDRRKISRGDVTLFLPLILLLLMLQKKEKKGRVEEGRC